MPCYMGGRKQFHMNGIQVIFPKKKKKDSTYLFHNIYYDSFTFLFNKSSWISHNTNLLDKNYTSNNIWIKLFISFKLFILLKLEKLNN